MFRELEVFEFLDLLFHLGFCEAWDGGSEVLAVHFGEEEPLRKPASAGVGHIFGTFTNKKEGRVVNVCRNVAVSRNELRHIVGDAEETIILGCDT